MKQSQSAVKHLFRMSMYAMKPNFFDNLKQFTKGIRRHVTDKKVLEGGGVSIIGKKKMGFDVCKKICELFLKEEAEEFIFLRAFLTLEWNLMTRLENVVNVHILHVHWDANCLVFHFVKRAKATRRGETMIKSGMFMPTPITQQFDQFLLLRVTYLQIQVYFVSGMVQACGWGTLLRQ